MKKWDVSYKKMTTGETIWYSKDDEYNCMHNFVEADSAEEAVVTVVQNIAELFRCNCMEAIESKGKLTALDPIDQEILEVFYDFFAICITQ